MTKYPLISAVILSAAVASSAATCPVASRDSASSTGPSTLIAEADAISSSAGGATGLSGFQSAGR